MGGNKMARKPKGEVARSETLAIRLDPRTRYMLELASRIQHRTLSSVVEWMINNSLKDIPIDEKQSLASVQSDLWDIDESDRLLKLVFSNYSLLSFDEQKIWKVIREYGYFWKGSFDKHASDDPRDPRYEWNWKIKPSTIYYDRVRGCWDEIKHLALTGNKLKDGLPKYKQYEDGSDLDDDSDE
jgi:hypothetical protein